VLSNPNSMVSCIFYNNNHWFTKQGKTLGPKAKMNSCEIVVWEGIDNEEMLHDILSY
jgi:hypothetical protein